MQRELNSHLFPPIIYSNDAIPMFLTETMEISHFNRMIKNKVEVDFDVHHDVPL